MSGNEQHDIKRSTCSTAQVILCFTRRLGYLVTEMPRVVGVKAINVVKILQWVGFNRQPFSTVKLLRCDMSPWLLVLSYNDTEACS